MESPELVPNRYGNVTKTGKGDGGKMHNPTKDPGTICPPSGRK